MAIAYLNSVWQPIHEAKISVLDRGFMFGDGVYEVIPVYQQQPFMLAAHLDRLANSLLETKIPNPMTGEQWAALISEGILKSQERYALIYIQLTRGVAEKREHVWPKDTAPTVLITVSEAPFLSRSGDILPYKMITLEDYRWQRGNIKSISLLASGLFKNEALSQGADDAILVREGLVTESSSSNIFMVVENVLVTPPASNLILRGITRDVVLMLARKNAIPVQERQVLRSELSRASEILVTSSGREIWPVGELDGEVVGAGVPGPVWKKLNAAFQAYKKA